MANIDQLVQRNKDFAATPAGDVSPTRESACRNHPWRSNDDDQHDPDHAGTRRW